MSQLHETYPLWATEAEIEERRNAEWGPKVTAVLIAVPIVARCEGDDDE